MRLSECAGKTIVIWGAGREGLAAARFLAAAPPAGPLVILDESEGPARQPGLDVAHRIVRDAAAFPACLADAEVIVKSPGISLYDPRLAAARAGGSHLTSLLNLCLAAPLPSRTIAVTGTKGKSTTTALVAHLLNALGRRAEAAGNIGRPVTEALEAPPEDLVIEVSSYQTATLTEPCGFGLVGSLYPEHLDWHGDLRTYYRDKLNLLRQARHGLAHTQVVEAAKQEGLALPSGTLVYGGPDSLHSRDGRLYDGATPLPTPANPILARPHNLANLCSALALIRELGLDVRAALAAAESFQGLPHRQQIIGTRNGVRYVDDGLSTTPQSTLAALASFCDGPLALLLGGHDRGVDYAPLIEALCARPPEAVIVMGPAGQRMLEALRKAGFSPARLHKADTMEDAVALARRALPEGGTTLLSPAAPSFGLFRDYRDRSAAFAHAGRGSGKT